MPWTGECIVVYFLAGCAVTEDGSFHRLLDNFNTYLWPCYSYIILLFLCARVYTHGQYLKCHYALVPYHLATISTITFSQMSPKQNKHL